MTNVRKSAFSRIGVCLGVLRGPCSGGNLAVTKVMNIKALPIKGKLDFFVSAFVKAFIKL